MNCESRCELSLIRCFYDARTCDAQLRARNKSCAGKKMRSRECAKHTFVLLRERYSGDIKNKGRSR